MDDKEILEKSIKKAEKNGYRIELPFYLYDVNKEYLIGNVNPPEVLPNRYLKEIVFSHDFAKALWGDDELDDRGRTLIKAWEEEYRDSGLFMDFNEFAGEPEIYYQVAWQYHLQKMILYKEPLKYLEKFL